MDTSLQQRSGGGINAFLLKLIAILGMTLDHFVIVFDIQQPLWVKIILFAFGGLTFPIMAFLLVEGYKHTSNFKRYVMRLILFAFITYIPYMWAMRGFGLNVLFTLLFGLITLYLYDHVKNRVAFWLAFIGLSLVTIIMDWSLMGVPMVLLYYVLRGKWNRLVIPVLIPIGYAIVEFTVAFFVPSMSAVDTIHRVAFAVVGCSLTIPLLASYNGQRGRTMKYLFYLYYPCHLLALALIRGLLFQDWALL